MLPDLERLIRLQQLESTADADRRRIAEQPERAQALQARIDAAQAAADTAKAQLADSQQARREVEKEVAAVQSRLTKFKGQLMDVKTNREYQAMQKEIEVAEGEVKGMEDRILELMLEADQLTATVKAAERALAAEQQAVATDRRTLDEEVAAWEAELEKVSAARAELVADMNPQLVVTFEQLANQRKGIAVAEARDGICTICHVRMRPQVFNTIRRNDAIIQCDHCRRILYFVAVPTDAVANEAVQ